MKCLKCGNCCYTKTIALTDKDIERISRLTNLKFYRTRVTGAKVLNWKEYKDTYICIFFDPIQKLCLIYKDRPYICKKFFCFAAGNQ